MIRTPGSDSAKVKGNIHWVFAAHAYECEVRMYNRLFKEAQLGNSIWRSGDRDFLDGSFQFGRHGYFVVDRKDNVAGRFVFNRTVTLRRDVWKK